MNRDFLSRKTGIDEAFPKNSVIRWDKRIFPKRKILIEAIEGDNTYLYSLVIDSNDLGTKAFVFQEKLELNGKPLFVCHFGEAVLFKDDSSEGHKYPADITQSALGPVPEREDNKYLTAFKEWISRFLVLSPRPALMTADAPSEQPALSYTGDNFASWFWHLQLVGAEITCGFP